MCQNDLNYFSKLTEEEKNIIIYKGTEPPFSGEYNNHFEEGVYCCKACGSELFKSSHKFKSSCGWPSFDDEIEGSILRKKDYSLGMSRTEIICSKCSGHLGHVFIGEHLTKMNLRHCVNSTSLIFKPK